MGVFGTAATSASVNPQLSSLMTSTAEEVCWLFAFLTAKEDAAVDVCIAAGIMQVSGECSIHCVFDLM